MRKQYAHLTRIEGERPESMKEFQQLLKKGLLLALKEKGYLTDLQCIHACKKLTDHD